MTSVFETAALVSVMLVKRLAGTTVRISLIVFDAVSETAISNEVKHGDVVTTSRASGFGVVTVKYKYLGFAVGVFGGQDRVRSMWRHIYQGSERSTATPDARSWACGCARFWQRIHTFHGNALGKDIDFQS